MSRAQWNKRLKIYATPHTGRAVLQLMNTFLPYLILLTGAAYLGQRGSAWYLQVPVLTLAGLFMVRSFILFHDCTHDSFLPSKKGNRVIGHLLGVFTFTPYEPWKKDHGIHHGAVGNLDHRGVGDIWTLTVEEYKGKSLFVRGLYRLFRNPFFLFGIAPFFLFMIIQRVPRRGSKQKERRSYHITNAGIGLVFLVYASLFGLLNFFLVQSIIMIIAGGVGIWLFYVQHQFEEVYWENEEGYDSVAAALKGSTFYQLPLWLEWISGYIGYHHIHHLNARIPNYHLKACYQAFEELKHVKTITLTKSLKLAFLQLYDTKAKRLISFRELALLRRRGLSV